MGTNNSTPVQLSSTAQLMQLRYGQTVRLGGTISEMRPKVSKAGRHSKPGRDIDLLVLKDQAGEVEVLAFGDTFAGCSPPLQVGASIVVTGAVYHGEHPKLFADLVVVLSEAAPATGSKGNS